MQSHCLSPSPGASGNPAWWLQDVSWTRAREWAPVSEEVTQGAARSTAEPGCSLGARFRATLLSRHSHMSYPPSGEDAKLQGGTSLCPPTPSGSQYQTLPWDLSLKQRWNFRFLPLRFLSFQLPSWFSGKVSLVFTYSCV